MQNYQGPLAPQAQILYDFQRADVSRHRVRLTILCHETFVNGAAKKNVPFVLAQSRASHLERRCDLSQAFQDHIGLPAQIIESGIAHEDQERTVQMGRGSQGGRAVALWPMRIVYGMWLQAASHLPAAAGTMLIPAMPMHA